MVHCGGFLVVMGVRGCLVDLGVPLIEVGKCHYGYAPVNIQLCCGSFNTTVTAISNQVLRLWGNTDRCIICVAAQAHNLSASNWYT